MKEYTGDKLREVSPSIPLKTDKNDYLEIKVAKALPNEHIAPYFPADPLVDAVRYARLLKRPLLLRGEPGSGKTKLAQALAYELHDKDYRDFYFEWNIKSTTKAVDGIYTFDHLARLRDANMNVEKPIDKYRNFGPLGKAFIKSTKGNSPSVLLIDEIDKADIDFPNDLLLELDQKRFYIEETKEEIIAQQAPIIIITSNDEKELPNAFLRRCLFHYIDFPDPTTLLKIVQGRASTIIEEINTVLPDGATMFSQELLPKAFLKDMVDYFHQKHQEMENKSASKVPSTSELIDWMKIVYYRIAMGKIDLEKEKFEDWATPEVFYKTLEDYNKFKGGKR